MSFLCTNAIALSLASGDKKCTQYNCSITLYSHSLRNAVRSAEGRVSGHLPFSTHTAKKRGVTNCLGVISYLQTILNKHVSVTLFSIGKWILKDTRTYFLFLFLHVSLHKIVAVLLFLSLPFIEFPDYTVKLLTLIAFIFFHINQSAFPWKTTLDYCKWIQYVI